MWVWIPVMIRASLAVSKAHRSTAEVASFLVIGCGAVGCVAAGLLADRIGRTVVTSWAMAISGSCCLLIGLLFGGNPLLLLLVAAIWGATVVADSAQFSACVTELGDPRYVGTALTMQTCVGFLLTTISIELIPYFVRRLGGDMRLRYWRRDHCLVCSRCCGCARCRKQRRSHTDDDELPEIQRCLRQLVAELKRVRARSFGR